MNENQSQLGKKLYENLADKDQAASLESEYRNLVEALGYHVNEDLLGVSDDVAGRLLRDPLREIQSAAEDVEAIDGSVDARTAMDLVQNFQDLVANAKDKLKLKYQNLLDSSLVKLAEIGFSNNHQEFNDFYLSLLVQTAFTDPKKVLDRLAFLGRMSEYLENLVPKGLNVAECFQDQGEFDKVVSNLISCSCAGKFEEAEVWVSRIDEKVAVYQNALVIVDRLNYPGLSVESAIVLAEEVRMNYGDAVLEDLPSNLSKIQKYLDLENGDLNNALINAAVDSKEYGKLLFELYVLSQEKTGKNDVLVGRVKDYMEIRAELIGQKDNLNKRGERLRVDYGLEVKKLMKLKFDPENNDLNKVLAQEEKVASLAVKIGELEIDNLLYQVKSELAYKNPESFKAYLDIDNFEDFDPIDVPVHLANKYLAAQVNLDDLKSNFDLNKYLADPAYLRSDYKTYLSEKGAKMPVALDGYFQERASYSLNEGKEKLVPLDEKYLEAKDYFDGIMKKGVETIGGLPESERSEIFTKLGSYLPVLEVYCRKLSWMKDDQDFLDDNQSMNRLFAHLEGLQLPDSYDVGALVLKIENFLENPDAQSPNPPPSPLLEKCFGALVEKYSESRELPAHLNLLNSHVSALSSLENEYIGLSSRYEGVDNKEFLNRLDPENEGSIIRQLYARVETFTSDLPRIANDLKAHKSSLEGMKSNPPPEVLALFDRYSGFEERWQQQIDLKIAAVTSVLEAAFFQPQVLDQMRERLDTYRTALEDFDGRDFRQLLSFTVKFAVAAAVTVGVVIATMGTGIGLGFASMAAVVGSSAAVGTRLGMHASDSLGLSTHGENGEIDWGLDALAEDFFINTGMALVGMGVMGGVRSAAQNAAGKFIATGGAEFSAKVHFFKNLVPGAMDKSAAFLALDGVEMGVLTRFGLGRVAVAATGETISGLASVAATSMHPALGHLIGFMSSNGRLDFGPRVNKHLDHGLRVEDGVLVYDSLPGKAVTQIRTLLRRKGFNERDCEVSFDSTSGAIKVSALRGRASFDTLTIKPSSRVSFEGQIDTMSGVRRVGDSNTNFIVDSFSDLAGVVHAAETMGLPVVRDANGVRVTMGQRVLEFNGVFDRGGRDLRAKLDSIAAISKRIESLSPQKQWLEFKNLAKSDPEMCFALIQRVDVLPFNARQFRVLARGLHQSGTNVDLNFFQAALERCSRIKSEATAARINKYIERILKDVDPRDRDKARAWLRSALSPGTGLTGLILLTPGTANAFSFTKWWNENGLRFPGAEYVSGVLGGAGSLIGFLGFSSIPAGFLGLQAVGAFRGRGDSSHVSLAARANRWTYNNVMAPLDRSFRGMLATRGKRKLYGRAEKLKNNYINGDKDLHAGLRSMNEKVDPKYRVKVGEITDSFVRCLDIYIRNLDPAHTDAEKSMKRFKKQLNKLIRDIENASTGSSKQNALINDLKNHVNPRTVLRRFRDNKISGQVEVKKVKGGSRLAGIKERPLTLASVVALSASLGILRLGMSEEEKEQLKSLKEFLDKKYKDLDSIKQRIDSFKTDMYEHRKIINATPGGPSEKQRKINELYTKFDKIINGDSQFGKNLERIEKEKVVLREAIDLSEYDFDLASLKIKPGDADYEFTINGFENALNQFVSEKQAIESALGGRSGRSRSGGASGASSGGRGGALPVAPAPSGSRGRPSSRPRGNSPSSSGSLL